MRAQVAWCVVGVATVAAILDTWFTAAHDSLLSEATWAAHGWPLAPLAGVGCALMGALIISRYPTHMLGWLLSVASLLSVTLAADAYTLWVLEGDGPGSAYWAHVIAWASPLLGWPAFTALIMVFLISPTGHLASPGWRWAVWATLAGLVLRTLGQLTMRPRDFVYAEQYDGYTLSTVLLTMGYLLVAAGLIASAASLVLRLMKARDDERRQLLWIASSAVFLAIGVVVILVLPRIQGEAGTWLAGLPMRLAQLAVPLCVAVAVLRHRLLQIDLIINRALMVALATGLAAIGYVSLVVVVGTAVGQGSRRLLAIPDRDSPGGARVPATTPPSGAAGRPVRVRRRSGALRGTGRLQPTARRQARPRCPVARGGRGRRSCGQRSPCRGLCPRSRRS